MGVKGLFKTGNHLSSVSEKKINRVMNNFHSWLIFAGTVFEIMILQKSYLHLSQF